ncbi:hypothetical protein ONS95_001934 [Cadophora gregata]|uniref:uncharacterized protein n=1 Tax=Cadophora gregata TaxID=51156 RepID=UPI0026DD2A63|nr:uncharacterized protein ONS95_001934 [Cadophora gregata]KAK0111585.1 hypothetical protein ONS95_001934 [Cadophora gregata]KAK0111939.1 hypothetical protein ONS96_001203 [Cadophora gregata f. sp. sojae]
MSSAQETIGVAMGAFDNPADDSANEELSDELPFFEVGLFPGGDEGSSFRTQNDPAAPLQRSNYIERHGAVDIRCSCLDVIHGFFSAESETFSTLIILQFRFDSRRKARRFQAVSISLEFGSMKPGETGPEVFSISPDGVLSLVPTSQHEEVSREAGLDVGGGFLGATAIAKVGWTKTVSRDTNDQTTVTGSIDLKGRNWGKPNCASWTLQENATTKTGVPTSMRTAILLKRKDENPFQCIVKINATVDVKSAMERVFGGKPKDDPVLFDPSLEPTNNLQKYDIEELGAINLEGLCEVTHARAR